MAYAQNSTCRVLYRCGVDCIQSGKISQTTTCYRFADIFIYRLSSRYQARNITIFSLSFFSASETLKLNLH